MMGNFQTVSVDETAQSLVEVNFPIALLLSGVYGHQR